MTNDLFAAVRAVVKGSGWSAKRDILLKSTNDWVFAVHPRRGARGVIEFRAKPIAWDNLLWSILQIDGNSHQPTSFRFIGAFTCDTPALVQENTSSLDAHQQVASQMLELAQQSYRDSNLWSEYDLSSAIAAEQPHEPYRYYMTRVVERICLGDRNTANLICEAASKKELDLRCTFNSIDQMSPWDTQGGKPSLSFFELAQIWMKRN